MTNFVYSGGTGILDIFDPAGNYKATTTQAISQSASLSGVGVSQVTSIATTSKVLSFDLKAASSNAADAKMTITVTDGTNTVGQPTLQ